MVAVSILPAWAIVVFLFPMLPYLVLAMLMASFYEGAFLFMQYMRGELPDVSGHGRHHHPTPRGGGFSRTWGTGSGAGPSQSVAGRGQGSNAGGFGSGQGGTPEPCTKRWFGG
jgi:hypothetical protein